MKKSEIQLISQKLAERLLDIDYNTLAISDYNKEYINRLLPALPYYMDIYAHCILRGLKAVGLQPADITLVDYGGGSGFLSLLAKEVGIGQVIYIDLNPLSVETIKVLKEKTDTGPDVILPGSSDALADWCYACHITPNLLIATDLIEHIYHLPSFFSDLNRVNSNMQMVFTTASTPYNPFVKRRLHRFMTDCETGSFITPNYYTKRMLFIREQYPAFTEEQVQVWTSCTRGLIFDDIKKAIESNKLPSPDDKYNTCDPETGNWAERILPIQAYKAITHSYYITVNKGFYNTHRSTSLVTFVTRCINTLIRLSGALGLFAAPFIFLTFKTKSQS